jgi:hypothetical protein
VHVGPSLYLQPWLQVNQEHIYDFSTTVLLSELAGSLLGLRSGHTKTGDTTINFENALQWRTFYEQVQSSHQVEYFKDF